jgi:hypothetical protein
VTASWNYIQIPSNPPEADNTIFCYRPGSGLGAAQMYAWTSGSPSQFASPLPFHGSNTSLLLQTDPYPNQPYIGDHVLCFDESGDKFNNSLLFYTPGNNTQSQIYNFASNGYTEVY